MIIRTKILAILTLFCVSCIHEKNVDIEILNIGDSNPNNKQYIIYVNESTLFKKLPFNFRTIKQKAGITESEYSVELYNKMVDDPVESGCEKCGLLFYKVKNDTVRSFVVYDYNDKGFYEQNRKIWIPFLDCSECIETKRNW
jgi:hypothetical protein